MIKNVFGYVSFFICIFCFLILVLVYNLNYFLMNPYECIEIHEILGTASKLKISEKDLNYTVNYIYDYLEDKRTKLDLVLNIDGKKEYFFTNNELIHMDDVKNIYSSYFYFTNIVFVVFLVSLVINFFHKVNIFENGKKITIIFSCFISFIVLFFVALIINFNNLWTFIHVLLFDNDLWMLNPYSDRLLMLFPKDFFINPIFKSIICYVFFLISLIVCLVYCKRKIKNHKNKK